MNDSGIMVKNLEIHGLRNQDECLVNTKQHPSKRCWKYKTKITVWPTEPLKEPEYKENTEQPENKTPKKEVIHHFKRKCWNQNLLKTELRDYSVNNKEHTNIGCSENTKKEQRDYSVNSKEHTSVGYKKDQWKIVWHTESPRRDH